MMERKPIKKGKNGRPRKKPVLNIVPLMKNGKEVLTIPKGMHQDRGKIRDWEPTAKERLSVRLMIASGKTVVEISRIIHPDGPVSYNTINRKFKDEISDGKNIIARELLYESYDHAMSNKVGNAAMKIFLLKSLFGLRDGMFERTNKEEDKKEIADYLKTTAETMHNTVPAPPTVEEEKEVINEN
jgi:hypothetical protein